MAEQKVAEASDVEKTIRREGRIHIHLVTLQLGARADGLIVPGQRDCVLPDEAVGYLPLIWGACIADREQPIDGDAGRGYLCAGSARRRLNAQIRREDWIGDR